MIMKKSVNNYLLYAGFILLPFFTNLSCISSGHSEATISEQCSIEGMHNTVVETMALGTVDFVDELVSNGRLRAVRRSRLPIHRSGELKSVRVINGQAVRAGTVLAELCSEDLQRQVERAGLQYTRSRLDMEDILLGQGFYLSDSLSIPEFTWQMAGLRSGYFDAQNELKNLQSDMIKTRIVAPYRGIVADLDLELHEQYSAGEILCTLIDDSKFLVEFHLMEKEIEAVSPGSGVMVSPFSRPDHRYLGYIHSVNPLVGKQGQVKVLAVIPGDDGLMDGMHVRINIQNIIPEQMVVPRSAVVYRDDEDVLFRYSKGQAKWTYVSILHQNGRYYSVIANPDRMSNLEPGDTIIISNNIHLANGSAVTPK